MTIVAIGAAAVAVILMAVQMKSIRGEYAVYMVCLLYTSPSPRDA